MGVSRNPKDWLMVKVDRRLRKETIHRNEKPVAVEEMVKEVNSRVEVSPTLDLLEDISRFGIVLKERIANMPWKLANANSTIPEKSGRRSIGSIWTTRQLPMQCSSSAIVRKVMPRKEKEKGAKRVRTKEKEKARRKRAKEGTLLTM